MLSAHPQTVTIARRVTLAVLFASSIVAASLGTARVQAPPSGPPKLIVLLVVDQMRADYLERYSTHFTGGLKRLMRDGAWFTQAAYPYLNTVTCPGHSTIGTGTLPYRHGMILNSWLDRTSLTSPFCTDDASVQEISYNGLRGGHGDSARRLLVPALGEQVRAAGGRAVAMSLKPRSAIPLVGHAADAVVWFDERGGWATSTAFTSAPVPFVKTFVDANPLAADADKVWTRSLDAGAYQYEDDAPEERPGSGMTRTFPHALRTSGAAPDTAFYLRWQRSPFSDEYLGRMAAAAVDALDLGKQVRTDFLAVSFSALDLVGHAFGPRSHEVQDLLVRLDLTIGRLLDHLDARVGKGNYVLGLSSDHGVAEVPEQIGDGGRQLGSQTMQALEKVFVPALGPGKHVLAAAYTDLYLTPATLARLEADLQLRKAAVDALLALPAIARVFRGTELASSAARASSDPVVRAAALSYNPGRSGDLIIVPREHWLLSSAVTTHGTNYAYDRRVPLLLFGAGVKAGRYEAAATPADLAPTLAGTAHVTIAPGDGRLLQEARSTSH